MTKRAPEVHCSHDKMVPLIDLVPNVRNPNHHPPDQIKLLAKIISHQGWRAPITVSKRSGFIVRGHCRLLAAQKLKLLKAPVDYQDYATDADEWADLVADNRLAELAELSMVETKELMEELLAVEADLDLTGFTGLHLQAILDGFDANVDDEWQGMPGYDGADVRAPFQLLVHFQTVEDKLAFGKLTGLSVTERTRSVNYPEVPVVGQFDY